MFVWVWNFLITYHDVPDPHIHARLNEFIYVRMFWYMSTPLYVHVTHTQHTHTRTHNTHNTHIHAHTTHTHLFRSLCMHLLRLCQGEPLCATCAPLHRFVTLGTVLDLKVMACAIICHLANEGVQHLNVGLGSTMFLSGQHLLY